MRRKAGPAASWISARPCMRSRKDGKPRTKRRTIVENRALMKYRNHEPQREKHHEYACREAYDRAYAMHQMSIALGIEFARRPKAQADAYSDAIRPEIPTVTASTVTKFAISCTIMRNTSYTAWADALIVTSARSLTLPALTGLRFDRAKMTAAAATPMNATAIVPAMPVLAIAHATAPTGLLRGR